MKRILLISLSLAVLLGASCKETTEPEGPGIYGATPAECIYNLELSFNDRDISIFEIQLAPDFTFWFKYTDVGDNTNGYTIPETWDFVHIKRAVWNIVRPYSDEGAYSVSLQLPENDIGTPPEGDSEYTAEDITVMAIVYIDENTGILVDGGSLEFRFKKTNIDGLDYWHIDELRDNSGDHGKGAWSLGAMMAYWYALNPLDPTE